ncbi:MAG: hypothetical protein HYU41_21440 [Candidatus Rokubacteria bacterium]|nr:hypothetical protein [Candidatus Rokubacteria bacterium]
MATPRGLTANDVRLSTTITTLRGRIREQSGKLLEDLERLHEAIDEMRPLVHTVEAFDALEAMDTQTFEALEALSRLLARSGFLMEDAARADA